MGGVARHPAQHPRAPHCPKCKRDVPTFDDINITVPHSDSVAFDAITFHCTCVCGQTFDLRKTVKGA